MFDRIAGVYDLMNTAMTAGLHHRWRARAVDLALVGPGCRVLDVATGTGDLAIELASRVAPGGEVIGSDFAEGMLDRARAKVASRQMTGVPPRFEWADAMELPYADASFDAATVGSSNYWNKVVSVKITLSFVNPLYGNLAGQNKNADTLPTIAFTRVIAVMNRTGVT